MATRIAGSRALYSTQRSARADISDMFTRTAQQIAGVLTLNSIGGIIPLARLDDVVERAGSIAQQQFSIGRRVFDRDGITPLSPFARILNRWLARVQYEAVKPHADYMERNLPGDVLAWLRTATTFEQFRYTNPAAQYEAAHTWVDPRGYTLSDRIWRAGIATRQQIDALLTDGIRQGRSAIDISRDLERFLLPDRQPIRTNKPYGTDASYHAMTLARSEITRAHAQATFAASRANPFVTGMEWALSARHPRFDVCDGLATIGMSKQRLREPYPLASAPMVVRNSHPNCICVNYASVSATVSEVVAGLRGDMQRGERALLTPVRLFDFLRGLLGSLINEILGLFR